MPGTLEHMSEQLIGVDPIVALSDEQLLDALRDHERIDRIRDYQRHALVAEAQARNLGGRHGCRSTANFLCQLLRISYGEARARVVAAENLGPRRALTGEPLAPVFPVAATAQADGAISAVHAKIVIDTVDKIPPALRAEWEDAVETQLVTAARNLDPRRLGQLADRLLAHVDPDGTLENTETRHTHRRIEFHRRVDGSGFGSFEADLELAELLATVLAALGAPVPGPDGTRDPRTSGQRHHDALRDALHAALRSEQLPAHAGCTTTVVITGTADQFTTGQGLVRTGTGARIPAAEANRWASSDSRFLAILTGPGNRLISHSLCQRLFSESQRLVMAARDKGCSFPGCTAPPWLCQAHHIQDWAHGGKTSISNGTLLCGYHHREFALLGWTCTMTNDQPHWTPPRWWDPDQKPLVNTAHDPPG